MKKFIGLLFVTIVVSCVGHSTHASSADMCLGFDDTPRRCWSHEECCHGTKCLLDDNKQMRCVKP